MSRDLYAPRADGLICAPLLPMIADQAPRADATLSVDPAVIDAIKQTDLIRMTAPRAAGGLEAPVGALAAELEAIAGACASTAWCLWNHSGVLHFVAGQLGPQAGDFLKGVVERREWFSFPQGAGSRVSGRRKGDQVCLDGVAQFGSGARYGDWAACVFLMKPETEPPPDAQRDLRFTVVSTHARGVSVNANWRSMSLRASATDEVRYDGAAVPLSLVRPFSPDYPREFRDPGRPMIAPRYREDWVATGVLWLAAQGVGIVTASLDETLENLTGRIDISFQRVAERPTVQLHLGEAAAALVGARAAVKAGCDETDARIAEGRCPTEADYLRQSNYAVVALKLCDDAMRMMLRVLGGNGLREEASFERRYRDFQALPLHITGHPDRIADMTGKFLLGIQSKQAF